MQQQLVKKFQELFGEGGDIRFYFSPGRVNLIGEHTDYNGGHVFPCALTIGTYGVARKREDRKIRLYSENFSKAGVIETSLDDLVYKDSAGWTNYPKGIVWTFQEKGYPVDTGFDMLMYGNIPNGSGLSSSASVELLMGIILKDLFGYEELTMINLALMGQYGENNFNGMNCGIMDQFAIAMGKKDHAIFLDTQNLQYEYAPIHMEGYKIVIAASNKKRRLTDSKYNERRAECEEALKDIQKVKSIHALGELTEEEFEQVKEAVKNPVCRKRAKHAVYENQRTVQAVKALKNNKLDVFGKLMNESHISLRDDYEVTGKELDTLVGAAWKQEGVIGSRMTGAGFGGCTVSIVREDKVNAFIKNVGEVYEKEIGYAADFYVVEIGDGTRRIA
ncbi:MAG TPA: galactokinase [Candidatus Blautia merdigallinarum]|uniref:Galactokinase n=1 Tax=Candidatus Blautia merdigallinarum TaxID=2838495 RepID=A0A9D2N4L3_9FIRM|nr:galactokinase [Candidatus Blautia merdigallinarum]